MAQFVVQSFNFCVVQLLKSDKYLCYVVGLVASMKEEENRKIQNNVRKKELFLRELRKYERLNLEKFHKLKETLKDLKEHLLEERKNIAKVLCDNSRITWKDVFK